MYFAIECSPSFASVSLIIPCLSCDRAPTNAARHTPKFPVTTTYITHTCSTVQPPHPRHAHVHVFFFSSTFTLSIRLFIYRAAAFSFITLSPHISSPSSLSHLQPSSLCLSGFSRLLPWLDFAPIFFPLCSLYKGGAFFYSCRHWSGLPPKQSKEEGGPPRCLV